MTKALRKAIMKRSRLKSIYNKKRSYENWDKYKKQRKFCMKLLRKTKQDYFNNIDIKSVSDTKKFWKTIKPYFSNKGLNSNKIFLSEKGRLIKDPVAIATTMNDYFVNITETIGLNQFDHLSNLFENHASIIRIKSNLDNVSDKFDFKKVHEEEVKPEIMNLNSKKATCQGAIPAKILKQFCDSYLPIITKIINESITEETFPNELKLAEVTPVFKKLDCMNKENYKPISLLSHMSKVFERILYNQLNDFMKDKLSNILNGFRKGHSAQHSLLIMIEKWKRALDENMKVGAIFMDLSKAFNTLNHRRLLAKLKAYGLQPNALKQMENYLTGRFQRTKVNNSYSSWSEIIAGVPQGSILGPPLFNIFLNDLFLYPQETYLSNYADDNTLYSIGNTIEGVKKALTNDFRIIQNWCHENLMVLNAKKCHYMCFGTSSENE